MISFLFYLFYNDFFMYTVLQWQSTLEHKLWKMLTKVLVLSHFIRERLCNNAVIIQAIYYPIKEYNIQPEHHIFFSFSFCFVYKTKWDP